MSGKMCIYKPLSSGEAQELLSSGAQVFAIIDDCVIFLNEINKPDMVGTLDRIFALLRKDPQHAECAFFAAPAKVESGDPCDGLPKGKVGVFPEWLMEEDYCTCRSAAKFRRMFGEELKEIGK